MLSTSLLLAASMVVGQAEAADPPAFSLADLECFVGEWEGKTILPEEADLWTAWKGKEVTVTASTKWILDKKALATDWEVKTADKVISHGKSMWLWDPSQMKIKCLWLDSLGRHGHEMWSKTGAKRRNKWASWGRGVETAGKALSGRHTITIVDEDTHVHEWTKGKIDDDSQPDMKLEYKRVER